MKTIREQFEEIWPVPKRIYWSEQRGEYLPQDCNMPHLTDQCIEWDARLDTFTRCQETTAIHMSIIEELIQTIQWHFQQDEISSDMGGDDYWYEGAINDDCVIGRAKKFLEQKK